MEILFKTENSIIKFKDRLDIERKYITTSTINGEEKTTIAKYKDEEEAKEIFEKIFTSIDKGITNGVKTLCIII